MHNACLYSCSYLAKTDPKDVARVENKTLISTPNKRDTIPIVPDGVKGQLGYWMSPRSLDEALKERFPGCMKGMYQLKSPAAQFSSQLMTICKNKVILSQPYKYFCII